MILFALSALFGMPAHAMFDDLGSGARGPGMGNAFTAVADDVSALYYNPAGLGLLRRPEMTASHSLLYPGLSDSSNLAFSNIGFSYPLQKGKYGSIGAGWQQLNLPEIYSESIFQLSYGRYLCSFFGKDRLFGGVTAQLLRRAFSQPVEAFNAMDDLAATGLNDPVLANATAKTALDADAGLLYQLPEYSFGITLKHIMSPNMAFGGNAQDNVPMMTHVGIARKFLWANIAGEARLERGPSGALDKDFTLAFEKVFPSLDKGHLGIRGAFSAGSRDFKQISAGLSYQFSMARFDYAFILPLGTVTGTAGTHRIGVVLKLGDPVIVKYKPVEEDKFTPAEKLEAREKFVRQIEELYYGGAEFYMRGRGNEAFSAFNRILTLDPYFEPAREVLTKIRLQRR